VFYIISNQKKERKEKKQINRSNIYYKYYKDRMMTKMNEYIVRNDKDRSTIGIVAHLIVGVERLQRSTDVNGMRRTAEELGFLRYGSERLQEPREIGTRRWLFRPTFHQYYLFRILIKYSILIKANISTIKQLYFF
jgi:hypothetical protein